ncbi:hypothetical protein ACHHV8_30450 [Paenibacillus sp. TAB 01]|uniref:hypothetical protein n=1 Tax=Paenibacillus sp. TAB 01 TaxID=3368988 RepID=UPI0037511D07
MANIVIKLFDKNNNELLADTYINRSSLIPSGTIVTANVTSKDIYANVYYSVIEVTDNSGNQKQFN